MAAATPHRRPPPPPLDNGCALFLDVDGTLLDFAIHPDGVRLPAGALQILDRLRQQLAGALALVSGRPLTQLDRLFAPLHLPAAGLHGQEFRGLGQTRRFTAPIALHAIKHDAEALALQHPGMIVEDKGSNLALHWRAAPGAASAIQSLVEAHLAQLPGYRLQPGDHVLELVPAGIDKGHAIRALMESASFKGRRPVFIGDDLTDEYGFATVNALGGWSVLVGNRDASQASYALRDPADVHAWLRRNASALSMPSSLPSGTSP